MIGEPKEHFAHLSPEELEKQMNTVAYKAYERRCKCGGKGCKTCRARGRDDDWALAVQIFLKPE